MKSVWLIVDLGKIGSYHQTLGLAKGLGFDDEHIFVKWFDAKLPWSLLPNSLWPRPLKAQALKNHPLIPPYPDLVIASGRKSAAPAAYLKNLGIHTIFILNPYMPLKNFDWVICPKHDQLQGQNVISTLGSLHHIDKKTLELGKVIFEKTFEPLAPKRACVLIGGDTKFQTLEKAAYEKLADDLCSWHEMGIFQSLLVTASRRTKQTYFEVLLEKIHHIPHFAWSPHKDAETTNPYFGFLSASDMFLVTNDSINMISEACYTQKPVVIYPFSKVKDKFKFFTDQLIEEGHAQYFSKKMSLETPQKQLNEVKRVVDFLKCQDFLP